MRGPDLGVGQAVTSQQDPAFIWTRAWIWTCHWSGMVTGDAAIRSSRSAGDRPSWSSRPYDPWSGSPSRHSAAQMIVPPGRTISAAADMPFTAWYRFWSSG